MKIRNGFVSNSSSSSFVAVLSVELYEEIMEDFSPVARVIVKRMLRSEHKLNGTNYVCLYKWFTSDADLDPLIEVLKDPKRRDKVINLPKPLKNLKNVNHTNVYNTLYEADYDPDEYVGQFESEVVDVLYELMNNGTAIVHQE